METALTSLGVYILIDVISLIILIAFKEKFILAARYGFSLLNIAPVVNNYNTYRTYSHEEAFAEDESEDEEIDEDESDEDLLNHMGGSDLNYGKKVDDE